MSEPADPSAMPWEESPDEDWCLGCWRPWTRCGCDPDDPAIWDRIELEREADRAEAEEIERNGW